MNGWLTEPLKALRRRAASQEHRGLLVDRTVFTDLHSLIKTGRAWEHREQETPSELAIETTNICNAQCIFCAYQYQDRFRPRKGTMRDEIFEKALRDYAAMQGPVINFTPLVGDPLMDKNIIPRIRRAKEAGFEVFFYTNGIRLNRIDQKAFLDTGVDRVMISTSPFDRESHEKLYRTREYDQLLEGVHQLLKLRKQGGYKVEIAVTFRAHVPLAEVLAKPDFQEYVLPYLTEKEIGQLDALVRRYDSWGGLIRPEDLIGKMQLSRPPRFKFRPCQWTFKMMVMYDGKVRACSCRFTGQERAGQDDGLLVGDLREQSLEQIWQGDRIKALRRSFPANSLPAVCRSCTMYRPV